MNLRLLHLLSAYFLWCLGTYALWLGEWEEARPYPILVVICAVVALVVTDIYGWVRLSGWLGNTVGILILIKIFRDLSGNTQEALTALAHFLIYLQIAKWFREKNSFDFGLIYLMNILQLAIGAILAKQSSFGAIIGLYFFVAIWCGMLFFLVRQQERDIPASRPMILTLLGRSAAIWLVGVPLALAVFWLLPRARSDRRSEQMQESGGQWTGFTTMVNLEKDSPIFENPEIAFSVRCRDHLGDKVELPADLLWKGTVLTTYFRGAWQRRMREAQLDRTLLEGTRNVLPGQWEMVVEKVFPSGSVLFAPAGVVDAEVLKASHRVRRVRTEERLLVDDSSMRDGVPANLTYRLIVDSSQIGSLETPEDLKSSPEQLERYREINLRVPDLPNVRDLALRLVEGTSPEDFEGRATRLMDFLTASGEFRYSLEVENSGSPLDPVEDFLLVRKSGHCEFFAGSLALLLRYAGIPARLVTGFKGVDVNVADGRYLVRQMFAHAWVEAYSANERRWITLDPTPGEARESVLDQQRNWWGVVVDVMDAFTRLWGYYVVNFSIEDQRRVLRSLLDWAAINIGEPLIKLQERLVVLGTKQKGGAIIIAVGSMVLIAGSWLLWRTGIRLFRRQKDANAPPEWLVTTYAEWLDLLTRHGWRRAPGQTAWELAQQVEHDLRRSPATAAHAALPGRVTDTWYAHRFGPAPLPADHWHQLESDIALLRADLERPTPPGRASGA